MSLGNLPTTREEEGFTEGCTGENIEGEEVEGEEEASDQTDGEDNQRTMDNRTKLQLQNP